VWSSNEDIGASIQHAYIGQFSLHVQACKRFASPTHATSHASTFESEASAFHNSIPLMVMLDIN
jgi:hypothetical protein